MFHLLIKSVVLRYGIDFVLFPSAFVDGRPVVTIPPIQWSRRKYSYPGWTEDVDFDFMLLLNHFYLDLNENHQVSICHLRCSVVNHTLTRV